MCWDLDVIMIGEICDKFIVEVLLSVVESGYYCFMIIYVGFVVFVL